MEYTVQAYLERRSSEELVGFLRMCVQQNLWQQYAQTVPLILSTLKKRNVPVPEQILRDWECFLVSTRTN